MQASAEADEGRAYQQNITDAATKEPPTPAASRQRSTTAAAEETTAVSIPAQPENPNSSGAPSSSPVVVGSGAPVTMPGFIGQPMRNVVAAAANLGLNVHVYGNGVAADQAPAAGTRVPAGTTVMVRFHP